MPSGILVTTFFQSFDLLGCKSHDVRHRRPLPRGDDFRRLFLPKTLRNRSAISSCRKNAADSGHLDRFSRRQLWTLEIVGLAAASAKYGALALHFYWIGAIPAMLFLALFMMPVYAQSKAKTLPEFLRLRYNQSTQMLNAVSMMLMMGLISGISLYATASLLQIFSWMEFLWDHRTDFDDYPDLCLSRRPQEHNL